MTPDIDVLYAILREWAAKGSPKTYGELSRAYQVRTGDWFEPHGSWNSPLGEVITRLAAVRAPALSALVIRQDVNEPGGGVGAARQMSPLDRKAISLGYRTTETYIAAIWQGCGDLPPE